jgi:hypothetical protein
MRRCAGRGGMSVVVCSLFVLTLLWALGSNRDIFSPAKFFLLSFLVFHLGALSGHSSYELWMLILLVLLVGAMTVLFEAVSPPPPQPHYALELRKRPDARHFVLWIWALSLPAIAGEVFLLWKFGGFQAYVNIISNRVIEFRGLGWALTLGATLATFNLAYFALGLTRTRSRLWWGLYLVHFSLALAVGLLSGSRGGTLNLIAMQLFCYHYIKGNIRVSRVLPAAVALLACAMLLGIVRNAVKLEDGAVETGLGDREQTLEFSTFQYGVIPLQLLLDADHLHLAYGMTLVTLVTNVVPRDWWPDKPDTGGVFFTKEYTGDAWNGASNLTPTFLGEGIINFGWVVGIAFFAFTYPLLMYLTVSYYRRTVMAARAELGPAVALAVVMYVSVMWSVVALMTAEVTATVLSTLLTKVAPLLLLGAVLGVPWATLLRGRGARPAYDPQLLPRT